MTLSSSKLSSRAPTLRLRGIASAVAILAVMAPVPANSATTMSGDEVIVAAHEIIDDDLIVWGSYIRIDGIVRGDLVALGTDIVIEGLVEGDLFAVGKTVYLNGAVHDDSRIAAYATALGEQTRIGDDCFGLAYSIEAKPKSQIAGTLWAAARQALLAGQIAEAVAVRVGALALHGLTAGDVSAVVGGLEGFDHSELLIDLAIEIPEVADGLRVATGAHIGGDLDYRAESDARVEPGATIAGETRREPWRSGPLPLPLPDERAAETSPGQDAVESFLLLVMLGFVLLAAVPRWAQASARELRAETVQALAWGVGGVIATGLASFVLGVVGLMSLVAFVSNSGGLALGLTAATFFLQAGLLAPFLVALLYVAPALACIGIGGAALARLGRTPGNEGSLRDGIAPLLVGCALYSALRAVPILGVFVAILGALAGLGALAQSLGALRRLHSPAEPVLDGDEVRVR